jgi:LDH2 family malate/lactate/ureidoglycolate dehydrogenase
MIDLSLMSGVPVTKPEQVKGLLALGGPEESSGYKGYGLAMMVEILCGILSGIRNSKTM